MKRYKLTKEEKQLLKEFNRGEWTTVKNFAKAKKDAIQAARNTFAKANANN